MKNTIVIDSTGDNIVVELVSSVDDGTNSLFVELINNQQDSPWMRLNNETGINATEADWTYDINSAYWVGNGNLTIYIGDSRHTTAFYRVQKVANATNNVGITQVSTAGFKLTQIIDADITAADVGYDNTESGLSATNVQEALDELAQREAGGENTTSEEIISPLNEQCSVSLEGGAAIIINGGVSE